LQLVDSFSFYTSFKEILIMFIHLSFTRLFSYYCLKFDLSIFLKKLYPEGKNIAFEAGPNIFRILKSNVVKFGFEDITLINKAP
jgi:hypothetical protein